MVQGLNSPARESPVAILTALMAVASRKAITIRTVHSRSNPERVVEESRRPLTHPLRAEMDRGGAPAVVEQAPVVAVVTSSGSGSPGC